jgi:hypothetical protein
MASEELNLGERGRGRDGSPRVVDFRLYVQLHVFTACMDREQVEAAVRERAAADPGFEGVLYQDLLDPRGVGLLVAQEDPGWFATRLREFLVGPVFRDLVPRPRLTMMGRTYAIGYENDLEDVLLYRTRRRIYAPRYPWAVWYPLRRAGSFEQLSESEQKAILMEHANLGMQFSRGGYGEDIRLACHGLDAEDNDFVVGLVGPALHPLSAMVQTMRKTQQTSRHLERLGPFFVGRVIWQSPVPAAAMKA